MSSSTPIVPAPHPQAMSKHYKAVVLGGGNSAGYLAREWVARGGPKGELAIVGEEPVRGGGAGFWLLVLLLGLRVAGDCHYAMHAASFGC